LQQALLVFAPFTGRSESKPAHGRDNHVHAKKGWLKLKRVMQQMFPTFYFDVATFVYQILKKKKMDDISQLITSPGTVIVDVRTPAEFSAGHAARSINIQLPDLSNHLDDLKQAKQIIVCCASGVRSLKASLLLKQYNIGCYDGGTWVNIDKFLNN